MGEKLIEFINILHVILLLEGDVDDGGGDILADAIKELGLTDDDLQFGIKVNLVNVVTISVSLDS